MLAVRRSPQDEMKLKNIVYHQGPVAAEINGQGIQDYIGMLAKVCAGSFANSWPGVVLLVT